MVKQVLSAAQLTLVLDQGHDYTHHFVGIVTVVFHAVLHQLLLVQVSRSTIRAHKCRSVWNIAASKEEAVSFSKQTNTPPPSVWSESEGTSPFVYHHSKLHDTTQSETYFQIMICCYFKQQQISMCTQTCAHTQVHNSLLSSPKSHKSSLKSGTSEELMIKLVTDPLDFIFDMLNMTGSAVSSYITNAGTQHRFSEKHQHISNY